MDVAISPGVGSSEPLHLPAAARTGARRRLRPPGTVLGLLALYVCWGSSIPAMKLMVGGIPPLTGAGAVFVLAGLLLAACSRGARRPTPAQMRRSALSGVLMLAGGQGLATVALTSLTASLTAVTAATVPLWVAVLAAMRGARPTRAGLVRLLAGFAGVVVVLVTAPSAALGGSPLAVVALLVAAVCWAEGAHRSADSLDAPADPRTATAIQLISGGLVLLALAAALGQMSGPALSHVTPGSLGAAAFLLFVDSLAGFALYQHLIRTAPLQLASSYAYATPVVAAAISIVAFGDHAWPGLGLGAALIVLAVFSEVRARPGPPGSA
jgi:drug/metabolite transporter (DMT)-like permease